MLNKLFSHLDTITVIILLRSFFSLASLSFFLVSLSFFSALQSSSLVSSSSLALPFLTLYSSPSKKVRPRVGESWSRMGHQKDSRARAATRCRSGYGSRPTKADVMDVNETCGGVTGCSGCSSALATCTSSALLKFRSLTAR